MNIEAVISQIGRDIKALRATKADKAESGQMGGVGTQPTIATKQFTATCPALRQNVVINTGIAFDKYVSVSVAIKTSSNSYERFANFVITTQGTTLTVANEARGIYAGKEMAVWVSYEV